MKGPRELAFEWRDALAERDAERFGAMFAPDGVMIDVEHRTPDGLRARPLRGRREIEEVTRRWCETTGDFAYVVEAVLEQGASAAVRWSYEWATGSRRQQVEGLTWLDCRDGAIVRAMVCFDALLLLQPGSPQTRR